MKYFSILCFTIGFIILSFCGTIYVIEDWIPICDRLVNISLIFGIVGFIFSFVDSTENKL